MSFTAKDVEYKMLTEGIKSDKYSVSPLFKNGYGIGLSVPYYFRERKNVIFIGNHGDKSDNSFYKILKFLRFSIEPQEFVILHGRSLNNETRGNTKMA